MPANRSREEAHVVGMVGDDEEVERTRELRRLAGGGGDLLALGEAVGVARPEPGAERAGIEGERGVQVRVAEERPGRESCARHRANRRRFGRELSASLGRGCRRPARRLPSRRARRGQQAGERPAARDDIPIMASSPCISALPPRISSKSGDTLDHPEHRDAADRVRRHQLRPARPQRADAPDQRNQAQAPRPRTAAGPASTPRLKNSSATGICPAGKPISLNAPAKPKPCSSPNAKATSQGARAARPSRPWRACTISAATNTIESAITASTGADGTWTIPERRQRQRDAVRDGERRDGLHQLPCPARDESRASTKSR